MALTAAAGPAAWAALPLALLLAWWWDHRFGEPPAAWHPVVWIGRALGPLGAALKRQPPASAFAGGAAAWCVGASVLFAAAWMAQSALLNRLGAFAALPLAALLKPMFAWRMLHAEVAAVEQAFGGDGDRAEEGGLQRARAQLARLVSRDAQSLDATEVREAAIETLAENLNDSVVAPLFWFALFGLPGAVAYRFANTADAMWGYRGEWEWAGKFAARADDVLSWLPARLTALWLLMGSSSGRTTVPEALWSASSPVTALGPRPQPFPPAGEEEAAEAFTPPPPDARERLGVKGRWRVAAVLHQLRPIARLTPSPNGGWPMGAMALRLGVRLGKPGAYLLNPAGVAPASRHIGQALACARQAARWALGSSTLLAGVASGGWLCAALRGGTPWIH